jgi:hypothetical protein
VLSNQQYVPDTLMHLATVSSALWTPNEILTGWKMWVGDFIK